MNPTSTIYTPLINKVFVDLESFFEENWKEIQKYIQEQQGEVESYV